jgi:hypothetical protein
VLAQCAPGFGTEAQLAQPLTAAGGFHSRTEMKFNSKERSFMGVGNLYTERALWLMELCHERDIVFHA